MDTVQGAPEQVANLGPGGHACLLYDDSSALLGVVVPYLRGGLAAGERCLYLGDEATEDVVRALADAGVDVAGHRARGALVLLGPRDAHGPRDFDPGVMLSFLQSRVAEAQEAGFTGVRIAVDMGCVADPDGPSAPLVDYESRANADFFPSTAASAVCLYDRRRFRPSTLRDALQTHPLVVAGEHAGPNLAYSPRTAPSTFPSHDWLRREVVRARAAEEAFRAFVDAASLALIGVSLDGAVTFWSRDAERLFGWTAGEALGQPVTLIIPEDRRAEQDDVLARLRRGEAVHHVETVGVAKDGRLLNTALTVSPIEDGAGRVIGAAMIARASPEREADEFLATVSHELRAPLNAIFGWARMLQTTSMDEATRARALNAIVRSASAQSRLIEDLLDLSQVLSGRLRLELQPLDLRAVIDAALEAVRPAATAKGISLAADLEASVGTLVGARDRLQQVVSNLVMHAVKVTASGGRVEVTLRSVEAGVEIAVADNGEGISSELLPHIFERFSPEDAPATRAHRGLGLVLVRHLVELHGGHVRAESPGKGLGATFTVMLPCPRS